jgi:hypothetical protein
MTSRQPANFLNSTTQSPIGSLFIQLLLTQQVTGYTAMPVVGFF